VLRRFQTTLLLVGLMAFVVVVIIPDIPTPDGVVKEQAAIHRPLLGSIGAMAVVPRLSQHLRAQGPILHVESLLDITCARLC
jgi:hypothetical protein